MHTGIRYVGTCVHIGTECVRFALTAAAREYVLVITPASSDAITYTWELELYTGDVGNKPPNPCIAE